MALEILGYRTNHGYIPVLEDKEIPIELPAYWQNSQGQSKGFLKLVGNVCFLQLELYFAGGLTGADTLNIQIPQNCIPLEDTAVYVKWGCSPYGNYVTEAASGYCAVKVNTAGVINISTANNLTDGKVPHNSEIIPENKIFVVTQNVGWKINRQGAV